MTAIQGNARRLGGSFAHWGGLFSVFDCSFAYLRGVEDPYNSIASGFFTGATLAIRGGVRIFRHDCAFGLWLLSLMQAFHVSLITILEPMPTPSSPSLPSLKAQAHVGAHSFIHVILLPACSAPMASITDDTSKTMHSSQGQAMHFNACEVSNKKRWWWTCV
jgi:hypothetical protein